MSPKEGYLQVIDPRSSEGGPDAALLLSLDREDPFLLETLEALIESHAKQGKSLILARVQTIDPAAPHRPVFFYYYAPSLNKVIFRKYGRRQEYLFRLFALNPLTNTEIVGDVDYFMVETTDNSNSSDQVSSSRSTPGMGMKALAQRFNELATNFPSSPPVSRISVGSRDARRKLSLNQLMLNSVGSLNSLKVAEIVGPELNKSTKTLELGTAARSRGSSADLKIEPVVAASRDDLMVLQAFDELQRLKDLQSTTMEECVRRLRSQHQNYVKQVASKSHEHRGSIGHRNMDTASPKSIEDQPDQIKSPKDISALSSISIQDIFEPFANMGSSECLNGPKAYRSVTNIAASRAVAGDDLGHYPSAECLDAKPTGDSPFSPSTGAGCGQTSQATLKLTLRKKSIPTEEVSGSIAAIRTATLEKKGAPPTGVFESSDCDNDQSEASGHSQYGEDEKMLEQGEQSPVEAYSSMIRYRAVFIGTDDDYLARAVVRKLFEVNALDPADCQLFDIPREALENEGIQIELDEAQYDEVIGPQQLESSNHPGFRPSYWNRPNAHLSAVGFYGRARRTLQPYSIVMGTFYVVLSGLVLILTSGTLTEKSLMSVTLLLIFVCVLLGVKVMDSRMTARWGVLVDEESLVESAS